MRSSPSHLKSILSVVSVRHSEGPFPTDKTPMGARGRATQQTRPTGDKVTKGERFHRLSHRRKPHGGGGGDEGEGAAGE